MNKKIAPWESGECRVPMWMGGCPSGHCGEPAFGHQYPVAYIKHLTCRTDRPYCLGHACAAHGGPEAGAPIIFEDGYTPEGRQMWCAVMPGFINLQESNSGFSVNPVIAVKNLRSNIAKATGKPA